jgi:hypothetical protein
VYTPGDPIQLVVSYATPIDQPIESIAIELVPAESSDQTVPVTSVEVRFDAEAVSTFSVTIGPQLEPGMYTLTANRESDDPSPTVFFVATLK